MVKKQNQMSKKAPFFPSIFLSSLLGCDVITVQYFLFRYIPHLECCLALKATCTLQDFSKSLHLAEVEVMPSLCILGNVSPPSTFKTRTHLLLSLQMCTHTWHHGNPAVILIVLCVHPPELKRVCDLTDYLTLLCPLADIVLNPSGARKVSRQVCECIYLVCTLGNEIEVCWSSTLESIAPQVWNQWLPLTSSGLKGPVSKFVCHKCFYCKQKL